MQNEPTAEKIAVTPVWAVVSALPVVREVRFTVTTSPGRERNAKRTHGVNAGAKRTQTKPTKRSQKPWPCDGNEVFGLSGAIVGDETNPLHFTRSVCPSRSLRGAGSGGRISRPSGSRR